MIFQRQPAKIVEETNELEVGNQSHSGVQDEVETVVGPSVNVEGDFASEGNIVVKGTVSGSVFTSKHLTVEMGAKIVANVRAGSATIAGEVKGNMKVKESLELTSTSKVIGDIDVRNLKIEAGAILYGKVTMPGMEAAEKSVRTKTFKKVEETSSFID
ncbi:MAG: polymer-forming cytoskeletal protein [Candidatus Magasanikbacteria bacterium]|nr:polymer-forming cytoskeletal protein [Candidatus Magasanikbacteria bacterium]